MNYDIARRMLAYLDVDDRDTWVRAAMSIKSEFGDGGFSIWDEWSQHSPKYKPRDARSVWRSVSPGGGLTIGWLIKAATDAGYVADAPIAIRPAVSRPKQQDDHEEERRKRAERAAMLAAEMLRKAEMTSHPYLERKGLEDHMALVYEGKIVVPMYEARSRRLCGAQTIDEDGQKKFIPGTRLKGAVHIIGRSSEVWLCEGYATALSVKHALAKLYRKPSVACAFSASNLEAVARALKPFAVIADNDASETGLTFAKKTGAPRLWMPDYVGMDANDYANEYGIDALANALRVIL